MEEKLPLLKYTGARPGFSEEPECMSRSFTQLKITEPNKNLYQHQWLTGESKSLTWQLNSNFLLRPIAYSNSSMAVVLWHHTGLPDFFDIILAVFKPANWRNHAFFCLHTDNKNSSFGSKNEDSCSFLKSIRKQQEQGYSTRKDKPEVMGDHRTGSTLTDYSAGLWHPSRVLITESTDSPRQDEVVN